MFPNKKIDFHFRDLSTKPSKNAVFWHGNRSILATIVLWTLCICRYLSLLQLVKECYRFTARYTSNYSKDRKAKRINVPPILPELYFIAWFIIFVIIKLMGFHGTGVKIISVYYLLETLIWILYYSIFRRFFEETYSIYHVLEYLLPLLLIFPTQAMCISILHNINFRDAMTSLLGNGGDNVPGYVKILGVLYGAIVIALLINKFPEENVRKSEYPVFIIGNGDVVQNRLYPALRSHYSAQSIVRYDLRSSPTHGVTDSTDSDPDGNAIKLMPSCKEITNNIKQLAGPESVVWISCPSNYHVEYLKELIGLNIGLIVCEKPICIDMKDLAVVKQINSGENRNKVFYLSYYILEKAMPLYYFCKNNDRYLPYLEISGDITVIKNLLGRMLSVNVSIVEGRDERDIKNSGGQLFETFIHDLLLASLFCGTPYHWEGIDFRQINDAISLEAECESISIDLYQEKNADHTERWVHLGYEYGSVEMNIETGTLTVDLLNSSIPDAIIKLSDEFNGKKYAVQESIVYKTANGLCFPEDVDGLYCQEEIIEWLIGNKPRVINRV